MTKNDKFQDQLREVFQTDLDQQVQIITDDLLKLEKGLKGKNRQNALNAIMRAAHNIKGAARGVGADGIALIAHHIETPFSTLKETNESPSPELVDLSLEALDRVRESLGDFIAGKVSDRSDDDLFRRLDSLTPGVPDAPTAKPADVETPVAAPKGGARPGHDPSVSDGAGPDVPAGGGPADGAGETEAPGPNSLKTGSEVIHLNVDKLDGVAAVVENLQIARIEMDDHAAQMQRLRGEVEHFMKMWALLGREVHRDRLSAEVRQLYQDSVESVSELNRITSTMHHGLRSTVGGFGLELNSLQDDIRMLRLVPADMLLRPLARSARDIARDLAKGVDLKVTGDDIELDRAVLDALRDPMVHLLRNAIDHGIEAPDVRDAAGKPEKGTVAITVLRDGGNIVMQVSDDGAGFDLQRIVEIAVGKNLVGASEAAAMDREEILDLVFRPGFSTSRIISDVSGRGVGLDVVRTNLTSIKGTVAVETTEGQGTTFTLRMPLTLVTDHGLMLMAGGQTFAVPITSVERVLDVRIDDIIDVQAGQAIMLEDRSLPLHLLSETLRMDGTSLQEKDRFPVVVVSDGWNSVAMAVDEVIGEREIVIKPLNPPLVAVANVAGGTLTGSGGVVMVLSPRDLVNSALRASGSVRFLEPGAKEAATAKTRILVVDDSLTSRTLEKSILENNGYDVTVAVDGKEAWERMHNEKFNLLVTDVDMPEMNGIELTDKVKKSDQHAGVPVVIVSSHGKDSDKQRGIDVGADAYIVKNQFESKALLDVIRQLV